MTTPDLDRPVATLRALLTEDTDTFRDLHGSLDAAERRVFAVLLTAAFNKAATSRFGDKNTQADVIDFVTEARAATVGPEVRAEDAENVIRAVLGEDHLIDAMDARTYGAAQTAMLLALIHETEPEPGHVEDLLATATETASSFLRRTTR